MARTHHRIAPLLLAAAALACSTYNIDAFPCQQKADCVDGYQCVQGRCIPELPDAGEPDAGPQPDAGSSPDAGPATTCNAPLRLCSNACTDPQHDSANCGECGNACASGKVCRAGACSDPAAPVPPVQLISPTPTNSAHAAFQVTSCAGLGAVLFAFDAAAPSATAAGWVPCGTSTFAVDLPVEGASTLRVWGRSPEGTQVSASAAQLTILLDRTAPTVSISALPGGAGADGSLSTSITVQDATAIASVTLEASYDGLSWSLLGTLATPANGAHPLSLQLPAAAGNVQLRARAADALGNAATTSLGTLALAACDPSASPAGGGRGTAGHPWRLCSAAQVANALTNLPGDEIALFADVDLSSVSAGGSRTGGTFDGQGHTLSHFVLAASGQSNVGLFGSVANGTVKNLTLQVDGLAAPGSANVGALAGLVDAGGTVDGVTVQLSASAIVSGVNAIGGVAGSVHTGGAVRNSSVTGGSVQCLAPTGGSLAAGAAGGAVGRSAGALANLTVTGVAITCAGPDAGGVVGILDPAGTGTALLSDTTSVSAPSALGGVVGLLSGPLTASGARFAQLTCTLAGVASAGGVAGLIDANGSLSASGAQEPHAACSQSDEIGGLAGSVYGGLLTGSTLTDGSLQGRQHLGGVVGRLDGGTVHGALALGQIFLDGSGRLGGVAGSIDSGTLEDSGSEATLTGVPGPGFGGLVGRVRAQDSKSTLVQRSWTRARILATQGSTLGGLVGFITPLFTTEARNNSITLQDCWADVEVAPTAQLPGGLVGLVAAGTGGAGSVVITGRRLFNFGGGPLDHCSSDYDHTGPAVTFTDSFWNGDRCVQAGTSPAGFGSPLSQAAFAQQASFPPSYDFANTWRMGPLHPELKSQPAGNPADAPPSGSLTLPAHVGAGSRVSIPGTATSSTTLALISMETSNDGGRTWIVRATIGPAAPGNFTLDVFMPGVAANWLVRLRLVDGKGATFVGPQGTLPILTCDTAQLPFGGGTGGDGNPWRLCAAAQFPNVAAQANANFLLTQDVDLSATPNLNLGFKRAGTFDGDGHAITGYALTRPPSGGVADFNYGLFRVIGGVSGNCLGLGGGAVRNLNLTATSVIADDSDDVGAFAGQICAGGLVENVNVTLTGMVRGVNQIGGIAGRVYGTLRNSSISGAGSVVCKAPSVASVRSPSGTGDTGNVGGAVGFSGGTTTGLSVKGLTVACDEDRSFATGGAIGSLAVLGTNAPAVVQGLAVRNVTVRGFSSPAGAIGNAPQGASDLLVEDSSVTCGGPGFPNTSPGSTAGAVGFIGDFANHIPVLVQNAVVRRTSVTCTNGFGTGGVAGSVNFGARLTGSRAESVALVGWNSAGGIVGTIGGGTVDNSVSAGRGSVTASQFSPGGAVGFISSGVARKLGTDAIVSATGFTSAAGLVGNISPDTNQAVVVDQCSSHAILTGLTGRARGTLFGNLGLFHHADGTVSTGGSLTITDCYSDVELPADPPPGGPNWPGGLTPWIEAGLPITISRVFLYGTGPNGYCFGPHDPASNPAVSSVFWNADRCLQSPDLGNGTPPPGSSGISQAAFAQSATFAGYDFNGTWRLDSGAAHPVLAWEATLPAPASVSVSLGSSAASNTSLSLSATASAGLGSVSLQVSLDGGRTWITIGVAGPLSAGVAMPLSVLTPAAGSYLARLVLVDASGATTVQPLAPLTVLDCDPAALPYGGGAGTSADPFRVCSEAQLHNVPQQNQAFFALLSDLSLTQPINLGFKNGGGFDGRGHLVSHVVISDPSDHVDYDAGFFGALGFNGPVTLKNLRLQVDSVTARHTANVGALVGHLFASGRVENCEVQLSGTVQALASVGGLVGFHEGVIAGAKVIGSGGAAVQCVPLDVPRDPNSGCCDPGGIGGAVGSGINASQTDGVTVTGPLLVSCPGVAQPGSIGGLTSSLMPDSSLTNSSIDGVTVTGPAYNVGGAVGNVQGGGAGVLSHVTVSHAQVGCSATSNQLGGVVGFLQRGAADLAVSDSAVGCDAAPVGGAIGQADGTLALLRISATRTQVKGRYQVGGLLGGLTNGGSLSEGLVSGQPLVQVTSNPGQPLGGVVGFMQNGTQLVKVSSDARLTYPSGAQLWGMGGIAGGVSPNSASGASISQAASRVTFLIPANRGDLSMVGGLVGEIAGNTSVGTVISDSYVDASVPTGVGSFIGGFAGQITGQSIAPQFVRVLGFGAAPSQQCLTGTQDGAFSGALWNTGACSLTSAPSGATGLSASQLSTLAGAGLTAPLWREGPLHPVLAWEP